MTEDWRTFSKALDRAYNILSTCPTLTSAIGSTPATGKWGRQSGVGNKNRAGLVNGVHEKFGVDGQKRNLFLRLDWGPNIFSRINVLTVCAGGYKLAYHLTFTVPKESGWNQDDAYDRNQMKCLTALVDAGKSIRAALDTIRSDL
jgi:hypothetical protein